MGLGLLSGRAEGGRARVSGLWPVGCARLDAPGARDRVGFWVRERGRVSCGAGRGLAPGGVARASVGGLLLAFARVAGRGARVIGWGGGVRVLGG